MQTENKIKKNKQKVSLVLSGGGARGMAHIGVIEELESQGYEIVSIAGTSMGALVGGFYAMGKLNEFKEWLLKIDKIKIINLLDFSMRASGLIKGNKIINNLKKIAPDQNIEDLKIPYAAVAADLNNFKEVVFTSGSIFDAIRASISIPTAFVPVKKDNMLLVDGGVVNNIPADKVKRFDNDILVAVDVSSNVPKIKVKSSKESKISNKIYIEKIFNLRNKYSDIKHSPVFNKSKKIGLFELVNKTISLMIYDTSKFVIKENPPDIFIKISKDTCGIFDFYKADELIKIGKKATLKALELKT